MTTPTDTLRAALQELVDCKRLKDRIDAADSWERDESRAHMDRVEEYARRKPAAWDAAIKALSAHPARASQEQGELSDYERGRADADREHHLSVEWLRDADARFNEGYQRGLKEAADRAARPESVDARRLDAMQANQRWHLDCEVLKFGKPGKWRVWQLRGNQMHSTSVKTLGEGDTPHEAIDAAMQGDAAIAKGAQDEPA